MGVRDHKECADQVISSVRCGILTVSDSRKADDDESGRIAAELFQAAGHAVSDRRIVPNDASAIVDAAKTAFAAGADLVVALGGTGLSKRDVTVEAIRGLMVKELPGYGELFRAMSSKEIGTAAILSRATLGSTGDGRLIAATPGSPDAVRLALKEILIPQLKHLLRELRKHP